MKKIRKINTQKTIGDRNKEFHLANEEHAKGIISVCKALASEDRLNIIKLLSRSPSPISIVEIANELSIAVSSTAFHVKCLEESGIIMTDTQAGIRGSMRLCGNILEKLEITLLSERFDQNVGIINVTMPVGYFYEYSVLPTCGMADENGALITRDIPNDFYLTDKVHAQLLWFHQGYVEYRFPNNNIENVDIKNIVFSLELCSETYGYKDYWPSDISIILNSKEIAIYHSPGDYGSRHGIITPKNWVNGATQYGMLKTFSINDTGSFIDGQLYSNDVKLDDLCLQNSKYISFIIAVKEDAKYVGGVNIFGKKFGDYPQDIVMNVFY